MKYVVLVGDGMADREIPELGGRTPLQVAKTPHMDSVAQRGEAGCLRTIPDQCAKGSDVANLSILGYDPARYYTGRGPLEAINLGVELGAQDVAFRCNLVTLAPRDGTFVMEDYSAGHITTEEARTLIESLDRSLGGLEVSFYPGTSYRHVMLWRGGEAEGVLTPPHDISGQDVASYLPQGNNLQMLRHLMEESADVLREHPVNQARRGRALPPATHIWLWGQGRAPSMPAFKDRYGLAGAVIAAVDLMRGIGRCLGLEVVVVPGATGFIDTNYLGKAEACLRVLTTAEFAFLHVEAPDEMGHAGDVEGKVRAIEQFDAKVVGTVLEGLSRLGPHKVLLATDHATPIAVRTHTAEAVPFAIFSSAEPRCEPHPYDERLAEVGRLRFDEGHRLMEYFLAR